MRFSQCSGLPSHPATTSPGGAEHGGRVQRWRGWHGVIATTGTASACLVHERQRARRKGRARSCARQPAGRGQHDPRFLAARVVAHPAKLGVRKHAAARSAQRFAHRTLRAGGVQAGRAAGEVTAVHQRFVQVSALGAPARGLIEARVVMERLHRTTATRAAQCREEQGRWADQQDAALGVHAANDKAARRLPAATAFAYFSTRCARDAGRPR